MTTAAVSRLNMRVQPDALERIREAANYQGMDVTSFVLEAASSKARQVALEEKILRLSDSESLQVADLIAADREPSGALIAAAQRLTALG
jgi:uncharacterized protein (DUF1778 family)